MQNFSPYPWAWESYLSPTTEPSSHPSIHPSVNPLTGLSVHLSTHCLHSFTSLLIHCWLVKHVLGSRSSRNWFRHQGKCITKINIWTKWIPEIKKFLIYMLPLSFCITWSSKLKLMWFVSTAHWGSVGPANAFRKGPPKCYVFPGPKLTCSNPHCISCVSIAEALRGPFYNDQHTKMSFFFFFYKLLSFKNKTDWQESPSYASLTWSNILF